jgi:hypothetical protein
MKRYKNIELDYGVNTALMEAYTAMMAEAEEDDEEEYITAEPQDAAAEIETGSVSSEDEGGYEAVFEPEIGETAEENNADETEGTASEIIMFDEE